MTRNILFGAVITLAIAGIGWNFKAVAEMPEKYVLKKDNREDHKEIKELIIDVRDRINALHDKEE